MTPICVLRSGGEFTPAHVQWLAAQVPGLVCLSDVEVPGVPVIPLRYGWPGWWSKLELFRPGIEGDLLYLDLDTVVLGDLSEFDVGTTTVLRDFYAPDRMGSGLMYLTEMDRPQVWASFTQDPERHMRECVTQERWGDQGFLQGVLVAQRWQDVLPGRVVSYKAHCAGGVPSGAKVVCFHGKPRPWEIAAGWVPNTKPMDAQALSHYNNGKLLMSEIPMSNAELPKYFKDAHGFTYVATPLLAQDPTMSPWNGAVDANGFAVDTPEPAQEQPRRARQRPADTKE